VEWIWEKSMSDEKVRRSCGGCTACCKALWVASLKKSEGHWCKHCKQGVGCKIYAKRPEECGSYQCSWLQGLGEEHERPDKTGVVIDTVTYGYAQEVLVRIWEVEKGALQKPFARAQLAVLHKARQIYRLSALREPIKIVIPPGAAPGPAVLAMILADSK
jgi:hypothetical protein